MITIPKKEIKLYNNKVTIYFRENPYHLFTDKDGKRIDSVTSASGIIDKSAPLMGWVAKMIAFFLEDHWKANVSYSKVERDDLIGRAKKEYRTAKKEAADIGTAIHEWIEKWIKAKKGEKPEIPDNEKVVNGITAFLKFQESRKFKWLSSERIIYSKKHNYAGILDAEAMEGKKLAIVDFKSSSGIYPEMIVQLMGYWIAREEETGKKFDIGYIIQFGKETGDFNVLPIPREFYEVVKKSFVACLTVKRSIKEIKSLLKDLIKSKEK